MGFLGSTCLFITTLVTVIVCFCLGIFSLFGAFHCGDFSGWDSGCLDIWKNTAWSVAGNFDDDFWDEPTVYCNFQNAASSGTMIPKFEWSTEYGVMVSMVSVGFAFLTILLFLMPCLLCNKLMGARGCGCVGCVSFTAWVFYLTAWAYWAAKDNPCKMQADADPDLEHRYYSGFICCVTLWCLLTLALPCMCGGLFMKSKDK